MQEPKETIVSGTAASKWWVNGFFGLHYDLHARAEDTELGSALTPEHLRAELEKVKPDFVQCATARDITATRAIPHGSARPRPGSSRTH